MTGRRFVTLLIIVIAFAMAISGWWIGQELLPEVGARISIVDHVDFASLDPLSDMFCSTCHADAVDYNDCMQCHTPTITYPFTYGENEGDLYLAHHDPASSAIIPPEATVLESCIDASCHNASPDDARYVTSRDKNHTYCW